MILKLAALAALAAMSIWAQSDVEGTWRGTLDVGATKLRLGLHIAKDAQGELSSTLDSIDQNAMGLPVKSTTLTGNSLHLDMPGLHATFDGKLSADGNQIDGTFTQGAPLPLTFKRVAKLETLNRPQNPKPPYPYQAHDVTYQTSAGIKLAGTLTEPRGDGPFPAAILITGSGPQDRDESLMGHKPFWVIADYLTRRGIAILRVDDRGMGGSSGNSTRTTIEEMAGDVITGVEFLKARQEIEPKHIGVIGHSEGAIVGPLAATQSTDIAFVVMLAGTGVPGEDVLRLQGEEVIRAAGGTDQQVAEQHAVQEMIFSVLNSEKDGQKEVEQMSAKWREMKGTDAPAALRAQFKAVTMPEMRSFLLYDPAPALRKLKVPVLALNGSRDVQVPPQQNLPAIRAALTAGGNTDFTVTELPGLNHLFQTCKKCSVQEYGELEETFSPAALEVIGDWLVHHCR